MTETASAEKVPCPVCGKELKNKASMWSHKSQMHKKAPAEAVNA